ncbi:VaFE repeat-containing surface-anchored protein [Trueperella pyogenes]|uniref:VaFE repeat-containing surface-anchored protein n=1 Tax=Trueperella pyogenes TaxID=1661 RepID=UPI001ADE17B3|nr:VaFE repeat-containing surface-anchored protein [Trueperella pyogenes]
MHFLDIRTTAADKADGDKLVTGTEITVVDEVAYEGLVPGTEYELKATLVDAETGEPVMVEDGLVEKQVTGSATFTPDEADGTQAVEIAFDGTGLGGKSLVVFEKLFAADVQLASHEDPSDEGQTVTVAEIGTKLTDAADGDQIIVTGKVKLIDTVEYKGLVAGDTYTVHGTLMVKSTGEALADAEGNPVVASTEFVAEKANGTIDVTFEFDASSLNEGDNLVAFEECLTAEGNLAAVHQDINDAGQTVVVDNPDTPEVPKTPYDKTGATAPVSTIGILTLVGAVLAGAGAAALALIGRRKKGDAGESEPDEEVTE